MRIIISTPNYTFGKDLKKSAPAGISVVVGYQAYAPDPATAPAVALVGFDVVKPCDVSKAHFVSWLLDETIKSEQCTLSYRGVTLEKQALVFGQIFDDMDKHKNDKPNPEDEA